jgi:hypothetical protein
MTVDADLRAARTPVHRALAKVAPAALRDAMGAVEAVAIEVALSPMARRAVERLVVHQVARALGVKAPK